MLGLRTSASVWTSFNPNVTWHKHYRMITLHRSYNGLLVQELAWGKKRPILMFEYIGPHLNLEKLKNCYSLFFSKKRNLVKFEAMGLHLNFFKLNLT